MGIISSRLRFSSKHNQESLNDDGTVTSSFRRARGKVENKLRDLGTYLPLYSAAVKGDWKDVRYFLDQDPDALKAKITFTSETALHVAVGIGETTAGFVEKMVREMDPESLAATNQLGDTALTVAASVGNIQAAMILVNKNPDLPNIPGKNGFPIHIAARFGRRAMVRYLFRVTKPDIESNPFVGEFGGHLLTDVITADFYDIALELVKRYPETATIEVGGVGSPLTVLTRKAATFSSGRVSPLSRSLLFHDTPFWRKSKEKKSEENDAWKLVRAICKEILELDDAKVESLFKQPLHNAAKLGIPEVIEEIVGAYPPAIWFTDKDNYNIFQLAVLYRREEVFNLIYQMSNFKYLLTSYTDSQDNNMLHLVARLPPSDRVNLVSGPAFQVQLEMQWFREVAKFVQPAQKEAKNKEGKTPEMVFTEAHKDLMEKGVKWMKYITTSSTVFATLVATIAFNAGMREPEGSKVASNASINDTTVLHYKSAYLIYVAADAISLSLSFISILHFLLIINSRLSETQFLSIVPQRLYLGLVMLVASISTVLIVFGVAFYLRLSHTIIHPLEYGFMASIALSLVLPAYFYYRWRIADRGRFGKKRQGSLH